jgi:hypothetical protein
MLFESISNSTYFKRAHLVLFLNKLDLFIEKLPTSPIRDYFEDYDGPDDDVEAGKRFFQRWVDGQRSRSAQAARSCSSCFLALSPQKARSTLQGQSIGLG